MKLESLRELLVKELQDIYDAEQQIIKALPEMAKATSKDEVREAFQTHLEQTKGQVERLDKVFEQLGAKPNGKPCKGMKGIIEEGKELLKEKPKGDEVTIDAGIIASAQKVEHYEIASYGTVRTYAETLGEEQVAQLLQETLDEEKQTDVLLTQLAETSVNPESAESAA